MLDVWIAWVVFGGLALVAMVVLTLLARAARLWQYATMRGPDVITISGVTGPKHAFINGVYHRDSGEQRFLGAPIYRLHHRQGVEDDAWLFLAHDNMGDNRWCVSNTADKNERRVPPRSRARAGIMCTKLTVASGTLPHEALAKNENQEWAVWNSETKKWESQPSVVVIPGIKYD